MRLDAHLHIWSLARGDYDWLDPESGVLYRDFTAVDAAAVLASRGIDGAILVQAAPTVAETDFLIETAEREPWAKAVVGWADLADPDAVRAMAARPMLRGLRPMLQDMAQRDWILEPSLEAGLAVMAEDGIVFEALIRPDQLPAISTLADRHPGLTIVIDHAAKPAIGTVGAASWEHAIAEAARRPNVHVKLSGLLTEALPGADDDMVAPYAAHLLERFGAARILWGSDWPVLTTASDYTAWLAMAERLTRSLSSADHDAIFGGNAARLYRIDCRTTSPE